MSEGRAPYGATNPGMADWCLWVLVLGYPVLFSFAQNVSNAEATASINPLGGSGRALLAFGLLFAVLLSLARLVDHHRQRLKVPRVTLSLFAFYVLTAFIHLIKGGGGSVFGIMLAGSVLVAVSLTRTPPEMILYRVRTFMRIVVSTSLLLAIVMPTLALVSPGENSRALFGLTSRLQGLMASPADIGKFASTLFLIEIALSRSIALRKVVFILAAAVATVWSQSRTSIGLIVIAGLIVFLVHRLPTRGRRQVASAFYWFCIGAMTLTPVIAIWFSSRLQNEVAQLTSGRIYIWQGVSDSLSASPFYGLTREEFLSASRAYTLDFQFANAHNQLLESLVTGGMFGAVLLFALLFTLKRALISRLAIWAAPLALSIGLFGQLAFGTPLRLSGLSWNVAAAALVVLCICRPGPMGLEEAEEGIFDARWRGRQTDDRWKPPTSNPVSRGRLSRSPQTRT